MSQGTPDFDAPMNPETGRAWTRPERLVTNPSMGLIVVGCLGIGANILVALILPVINPPRVPDRPAGMDDGTYEASKAGAASAPLCDCCCITLTTLLVYPLVIVAGFRMRQLRSRMLVILGAILAMFPCSPVILLGVPIGIWALVVLNDRDVVAAFAANKPAS